MCAVGVGVALDFFWLRDAGLLRRGFSNGMGVDRLLLGGGASSLVGIFSVVVYYESIKGIARSVLKGLTGLVEVGPSV